MSDCVHAVYLQAAMKTACADYSLTRQILPTYFLDGNCFFISFFDTIFSSVLTIFTLPHYGLLQSKQK